MNSMWEVIGAWGRFMGVGISPTTVERITDFAAALMGLAIFASAVLPVKRGTVWTGLVATGMAAVSVRYYQNSSLPESVDYITAVSKFLIWTIGTTVRAVFGNLYVYYLLAILLVLALGCVVMQRGLHHAFRSLNQTNVLIGI